MKNEPSSAPIPTILGGDLNAYSMARGFFEEFSVPSYVFARDRLGIIDNIKYINLHVEGELDDCDRAVPELLRFARSVRGQRPILIPCADWYMELLQYDRDALDGHFYFNIPSFETWRCVSDKATLYGIFKKYGIRYPETAVISSSVGVESIMEELGSEAVIKPSDSALYWRYPFDGMRKVYFAKRKTEAREICQRIFASGYLGKLILQRRILSKEGGHPSASVLTTYSNRHGRVIRACLADVLLEQRGKTSYGNYLALVSRPLDALSESIIDMLEGIGYTGVANFDIIEGEGGRFCLELNPRQGRSFDYLRASEISIPRLLYADSVGEDIEKSFDYPECLWSAVPEETALKYSTDKGVLKTAEKLYRLGRSVTAMEGEPQGGIARKIYIIGHNIKQNLNLKRESRNMQSCL